MVTRDDLEDGGASHVVNTMREVRTLLPSATIEVLTSDFGGCFSSVETVLAENPEVFAHNVETVRSLSPTIRCKATYDGSIEMLRRSKQKNPTQVTKSSLMVGLGERVDEVIETLQDLAEAGVDIVTIGQYLQPSGKKMAVKEWIAPEMFRTYEEKAKELGIKEAVAGPFVRSSYRAHSLQVKEP